MIDEPANDITEAITRADVVSLPGRNERNAAGGGDSDLNRRLADKEKNNIGNADRLIARCGGDLMYVRDVGWFTWRGTHWNREGADDAVKILAHATSRSIMEEAAALRKAGTPDDWGGSTGDWNEHIISVMKWSWTSGDKKRITAMVTEAQPYLSHNVTALDQDRMVINLLNGTLRLESACEDLMGHERGDRLSKIMNVEFDPQAKCPEFEKFLHRVHPDGAARRFLQVWMGYCLSGDTGEQKVVFNYGEGGNGKSVFIDLMARIMGPYSLSLPFASLMRDEYKRGSDATPDLARLPGVRFARASESERGASFAEAQIKAMTGGEEMTARHLNKGFFDFVPEFKLMLSGNHKPRVKGNDRGTWRRLLLVPWTVNVPEDEQDEHLPEKLWSERAGVLNWMLDGARLWLEDGLLVPDIVRGAIDKYKSESDPLGRFIEQCVAAVKNNQEQASVMYAAYKSSCVAHGENIWSQTAFGKGLIERGLERDDKGQVRMYCKVMLVDVPGSGAHDEPPPVDGDDDFGRR
jgi:putative DNA primase/helicase